MDPTPSPTDQTEAPTTAVDQARAWAQGLDNEALRAHIRALQTELESRNLEPSASKIKRDRRAKAKLREAAEEKLKAEKIKHQLIQQEEQARVNGAKPAEPTTDPSNNANNLHANWKTLSVDQKIAYAARLPSNYDDATCEKYVRDSFKQVADEWEKKRAALLEEFKSPPKPDPKAREEVISMAIRQGASRVDAEHSFAHQWATSISKKVDERRHAELKKETKTHDAAFTATRRQIEVCTKRKWVQYTNTAKLIEFYESPLFFTDEERRSITLNAFVAATFGGRLNTTELSDTISLLKMQAQAAQPAKQK